MQARVLWDEKWKLSAQAADLEEAGEDVAAAQMREREEAAAAKARELEAAALNRVGRGHDSLACTSDDCGCGFAEVLDEALAAVWRRATWRALEEFDCGCGRSRCSTCCGVARLFKVAHQPEVPHVR